MSKRLVIVSIVIAVLLGGLAYFQFVFKPQMIRSFLSQMTPPPATVAGEPARTEKWVEQLTSIGTLIASQGVDINTPGRRRRHGDLDRERAGRATQGAKLVQLDIAVEIADLASAKATLAGGRGRLPAPGRADAEASHLGGQPRHRPRQARHGGRRRQAHRGRDRPEGDRCAVRRPARHPQGREGPVRLARHGAGVAAGARSDPRRFPDARADDRQAQGRPDHRAHGRCLSRPGLQGRDPVARRARGAGHAHAAGARAAAPTRSASCCPACSPTSRCWRASRATSSPCRARRSPTASTATASTW